MVRTSSTMLPLGTLLPTFDLPVVFGTGQSSSVFAKSLSRISNDVLSKKPILLMSLCAHCPFVKHIESELSQLDADFGDDVQFIGFCSNSLETHPQDGPEFLGKQANKNGWRFPYLLDLDHSFAKSLKAACTPDFFLFSLPSKNDHSHRLIYRGQLDDSRPGNNISLTGKDLREALKAALTFKKVGFEQKPSIGCNIKWQKGSEPFWFI